MMVPSTRTGRVPSKPVKNDSTLCRNCLKRTISAFYVRLTHQNGLKRTLLTLYVRLTGLNCLKSTISAFYVRLTEIISTEAIKIIESCITAIYWELLITS